MKNAYLLVSILCLASCSSSGKKEELKKSNFAPKVLERSFEYIETPVFPLKENQRFKETRKGIIIQETKTRVGYDFYERFSFAWNGSSKDIVIKELANPLWGSFIWIEIDNNRIWQKSFGPRSRDLEETISEAIKITRSYLNFIKVKGYLR